MTDIVDAIASFRVAFLRENLRPPTTILLEDHSEGMRFLSLWHQSSLGLYVVGDSALGKVVENADGSVYMEVEIMGMKVRWPANRYATPDGTWRYA